MSWPRVKLSDVATINPRPPRNVDDSQQVTFVAMASASEDGYLLASEARVLAETKKGFTYFDKSDVLLAKITPCFENGKSLRPGQIDTDIGFGSTEFHVVRPEPKKLDGLYLFYLVWNEQFRFWGEKSMSGAAGQKRVGSDFLKGFEIPLPPLPEQKRIAAILDKADAIRRKRQQAIQLADDFLRAVFLDMFGDPRDSLTIKDMLSQKYLILHKDGNHGSNYPKKEEFGDDGVAFISAKDVSDRDGSIDYSSVAHLNESRAKKLTIGWLKKGDVLLAHNATVGRVGIFSGEVDEAIIGTSLTAFRPNQEKLSSVYLFAALKYSSFQVQLKQNMGQSTRNQVPITAQKSLRVPVGDFKRQRQFEKLFIGLEQAKLNSYVGLKESDEMFLSLGQKAFSGQL